MHQPRAADRKFQAVFDMALHNITTHSPAVTPMTAVNVCVYPPDTPWLQVQALYLIYTDTQRRDNLASPCLYISNGASEFVHTEKSNIA